jgi:predicted RecB family nuclease
MADSQDKRRLFSLGIVAVNEERQRADLYADFALAWSEDDARAKGRAIGKKKYPDASIYHVAVCELMKGEIFEQFINEAVERADKKMFDRMGEEKELK